MKNITYKIFTLIFSTLFISVMLPGLATAQSTFPLNYSYTNQNSVIKVVLKNNTQTNYTARVALFSANNTYTTGNNYQYVLIPPGNQKEFAFTGILIETYTAKLIATKDANPNPTNSIFFNKDIIIKNSSNNQTNNPPPNPPPAPPVTSNDIKVTISVLSSEKEVKVTILNNTDDPLYKITTTLTNSIGYTVSKSGNFDRIGGQIIQSFTDLTSKSPYNLTVQGSRVTPTSKVGTITKSYSFQTNFTKPGIQETGSTSTPAPADPNTTTTTPANTTTGTGAASTGLPSYTNGLTPEQIAADKVGNGLVPCRDTCTFEDILSLINNLITFLITTIFIPIIIILFMYAGYKYITAGGNPAKIANLKSMIKHIVVGMLLVLCSWLIVKTVITILASDEVGATQFLK